MSYDFSKLNVISDFERLKYKAADYMDKAPRGTAISCEDVFGNSITDDEYYAFASVAECYFRYDFYYDNPYTYWRNIPETQEEMDETTQRAANGDTISMLKIGYFLQTHERHEDAIKWYEAAAEHGNSIGLVRLGGAYKYGDGVPADIAQAIDYYEQAILLDGNDEGLLDLGLCYLHGDGVPQDFRKGYELMIRSAKQGNSMARYNMGWMYHYGRGVKKDLDQALVWYELGAGGYYLKAYTNLTALCYDRGDYEKMISWTKRYMELDEPKAFFRMGCYLLEGVGVDKYTIKGIEYLEKAAEKDEPMAHLELSRVYSVGEGVEPDGDKSYLHLREAARLRDPNAEFLLGQMMWDSERETALSLIQDAASQWHVGARTFLQNNGYPLPSTKV